MRERGGGSEGEGRERERGGKRVEGNIVMKEEIWSGE